MNITVSESQILMVNDISAVVGGEYTCIVFNDEGIGLATSNIFVTPYFTKEPMDVEVDYFDQVILSCEAVSFPQSEIHWQKLNNEDQFVDINGENDSTLIYENAIVTDSGLYRCVASIAVNGTEYMTFSRNATITGNVKM